MMFIMHISALLALGVLLGSTALIVYGKGHENSKSASFGKKVGWFTFILSILSFVCVNYFGVKYWLQGEFESSSPMHMKMSHGMMGRMMPPPHMMDGMMGPKSDMGSPEEKDSQEHSHNH